MIYKLMDTIKAGARTNKFRVTIPLISDLDSENFDIVVESTTLPSKTIVPTELTVRGRKVQMRGETSLENTWDVTFYNTEDMFCRYQMLLWMNLVHQNSWNPSSGSISNILSGVDSVISGVSNLIQNPMSLFDAGSIKYQRDIFVEQLDHEGKATFKTILVGAFPINVSNVELNNATGDVSKTSVTFAFTDLKFEIENRNISYNDIKSFLQNLDVVANF